MNIELFNKVKEHILTKPNTFDMNIFLQSDCDLRDYDFRDASCDTVGCIAGWACYISGEPYADHDSRACELLEIDYEDARKLFYLHYWPVDFLLRWDESDSEEERAKVTVEYIDRFISEHNGE